MKLLNKFKIADNQDEFKSSLFLSGGTCDGVITKINKRSVHFKLFDHNFVINKFGCLCFASDNGRFYPSCFSSYFDDLDYDFDNDFIESLTVSKNYNGKDTIFNFKGA